MYTSSKPIYVVDVFGESASEVVEKLLESYQVIMISHGRVHQTLNQQCN